MNSLLRATSHDAGFLAISTPGPYFDQQDLVADRLRAIRMRAVAAAAHLEGLARGERACDWPTDLEDLESSIEARLDRTDDRSMLPTCRLAGRFSLSREEQHVLWTLIANELCPIARQLIRNLATEQTSDPTTDTVRRIVYGSQCGPNVWHELGERGPLRRLQAWVDEFQPWWGTDGETLENYAGYLSNGPSTTKEAR